MKKLDNDELEFALVGSAPFAWGAGRRASIRSFYLEHMSRDTECLTQPLQLAGTTIATPTVSTSHFQLLAVLRMFSLASVTVVFLSPSDIVRAWDEGTIDGAYLWQPSLQHILENGGHNLITGGPVTDWGKATFSEQLCRRTPPRRRHGVAHAGAPQRTLFLDLRDMDGGGAGSPRHREDESKHSVERVESCADHAATQ